MRNIETGIFTFQKLELLFSIFVLKNWSKFLILFQMFLLIFLEVSNYYFSYDKILEYLRY